MFSLFAKPCCRLLSALLAAFAFSFPVNGPLSAAEEFPGAPEDERWLRRKPEVERVIIDGSEQISDGEIRRHMEMRPSSVWATFGLRRKRRVLRGARERDRMAILTLYETHGFLRAEVALTVRKGQRTGRAIVEVLIHEGPRTVWGEVTLTGDDSEPAWRTGRWLRQLQRGKPANPRLLQKTLALCQSTYADFGYPYAQFAARWNVDSTRWDTAHITLTVDPGAQVHFGQVQVVGNTYTKSEVIRRELAFKAGDLYSRHKIIESQNNIYRTGLFTYTRLQVKTDSTNAETRTRRDPDFLVKVVERKPSYVEFTTGAGQDEQYDLTFDYSLEWGTRNWLGTGRRWALQAKSEFRTVEGGITKWTVLYHRFAARYTEPWIFGLRLPTTLQLSYEPGVHSAIQPYRIEKIEGELSFLARFGLTKKAWLSLVYESVNIDVDEGVDRSKEDILREEGITITRKVVFALEKDSRPNIFVPAAGSLTRLDFEYAGGLLGEDVDYYKIVASWARYQTVAASVFASRFKFGRVKTHSGGRPLPTIDRFYLGGANSIRGYQENRVGPITDGIPEGGGILGVANLELRTPVIWKLWFTVFGDAGNTWKRSSDVSVNEILVSVGVGLQYISPVGPLRLDYARRVVHRNHPGSDRLHLAILFAF